MGAVSVIGIFYLCLEKNKVFRPCRKRNIRDHIRETHTRENNRQIFVLFLSQGRERERERERERRGSVRDRRGSEGERERERGEGARERERERKRERERILHHIKSCAFGK